MCIYRVSFTIGGLFHQEAVKVAALYSNLQNWEEVRKTIFTQNTFQSRTRASTRRIAQELIPRLQQLSPGQLEILIHGDPQEQKQIMWIAICKQYALIQEFAIEVIHEKMLRSDPLLAHADFNSFLNAKSEWFEELAALKKSTRQKLGWVLFKMLREAGIISPAGQILPLWLSPRVARSMIIQGNKTLYAIFPIPEADFRKQVAR